MLLFVYQWRLAKDHVFEGYGMTDTGVHQYVRICDIMNYVYTEHSPHTHHYKDVVLTPLYGDQKPVSFKQVFFRGLRPDFQLQSMYDHQVDFLVKCLSYYELPPNGWLSIPDHSVDLSINHIERIDHLRPIEPRVLSFDIEVYSINPRQLPLPEIPENVIFQISLVMNNGKKRLLTLGCVSSQSDFEVCCFQSETDLLSAFLTTIHEWDPTICIGYNIFGFDLPYLFCRMTKSRFCLSDDPNDPYNHTLHHLGIRRQRQSFVDKSWSSVAHGTQKIYYPDNEGRLWIDMFVYMKRNFKLDSYKLDSVAQTFLQSKKNPMTHYDIFDSYRTQDIEQLTNVGKYCIQDSVLVLQLFEKFEVWVSYTEMSRICNVPIHYLHTRGEQIKTFAQVYQYCCRHQLLMNTPHISERQSYEGATVMDPEPGMYRYVVPFDFASLYPTTMIVFNIDITTLYRGKGEPPNPEHYHRIVVDPSEIYYFQKEPLGVIPTILKILLDTRKQVRQQMKQIQDDPFLLSLLNKRQLSYKLSANSMYGVLGQSGGLLPFVQGAKSITAQGRENLRKAGELLQSRFHAKLVYQDTDSCYCQFHHIAPEELYKHAEWIEQTLVDEQIFPSPMKLEFENTVYDSFYIPTKKRYLYTHLKRDGQVTTHIECKGFEKRDVCPFSKEIYIHIIQQIFQHFDKETILLNLRDRLFNARIGNVDMQKFVMTKTVANPASYKSMDGISSDQIINQFIKGFDFPWIDKLPAHMKLAYRMIQRGIPIEIGDRIAFVITERGKTLSTQIDDIEYVMKNRRFLHINSLKYIEDVCRNIQSVFSVVFKDEYSVTSLAKTFHIHHLYCQHIERFRKPSFKKNERFSSL